MKKDIEDLKVSMQLVMDIFREVLTHIDSNELTNRVTDITDKMLKELN